MNEPYVKLQISLAIYLIDTYSSHMATKQIINSSYSKNIQFLINYKFIKKQNYTKVWTKIMNLSYHKYRQRYKLQVMNLSWSKIRGIN